MMLVDSHCHLDYPEFEKDVADVVARAHDAGVGLMLTICTRLSRFARVCAVAERFDSVWATVGVHPHEAGEECPSDAQVLLDLADAHPKVVGFGETGLDYYYEHSPRKRQIASFHRHIDAARERDMPVIVHTRAADDDTLAILRAEMKARPFAGVIHCFSSSRRFADEVIEMGLYISISGIVTFKKSVDLQEVVRCLPCNRLLVETDAPFLAPTPRRGRRNEPAFVAHTAAKVAQLRGVPVEQFIQSSSNAFFGLFSRAMPLARDQCE